MQPDPSFIVWTGGALSKGISEAIKNITARAEDVAKSNESTIEIKEIAIRIGGDLRVWSPRLATLVGRVAMPFLNAALTLHEASIQLDAVVTSDWAKSRKAYLKHGCGTALDVIVSGAGTGNESAKSWWTAAKAKFWSVFNSQQ